LQPCAHCMKGNKCQPSVGIPCTCKTPAHTIKPTALTAFQLTRLPCDCPIMPAQLVIADLSFTMLETGMSSFVQFIDY
jgi:hypothetical protein